MTQSEKVDIGVIGGTGFYDLLEDSEKIKVNTPYGPTSASYVVGEIGEKKIAFLARHGEEHQYPPHKVPYRANLFGMKTLGVKYLILPCACGSLKKEIEPGSYVVCDQFVDRTKGRKDTFFDGPSVAHVSCDEPYCDYMRKLVVEEGKKMKLKMHDGGSVVVINGPRFSSKAESRWFKSLDYDVINMTAYPEVVLARELEMCAVNISVITDYDTGVKEDGDVEGVSTEEVLKQMHKSNEKLKKLIGKIIKVINTKRDCECHHSLEKAYI